MNKLTDIAKKAVAQIGVDNLLAQSCPKCGVMLVENIKYDLLDLGDGARLYRITTRTCGLCLFMNFDICDIQEPGVSQ